VKIDKNRVLLPNQQLSWNQVAILSQWHRQLETTVEMASYPICHSRLTTLYSEPHRYYHNLYHVASGLEHLTGGRSNPLVYAWLFHDAIYVPGASDNEWRSWREAEWWLMQITSEETFYEKVKSCILATKHDTVEDDPDCQLICDIDLSGFALLHPLVVDEQLRLESGLSGPEWSPKRATFLEGMLRKPRIYYQFTDLEEKARENIQLNLLYHEELMK
jgi:predicted metal-dependent HD superfamily phosphohydrolase